MFRKIKTKNVKILYVATAAISSVILYTFLSFTKLAAENRGEVFSLLDNPHIIYIGLSVSLLVSLSLSHRHNYWLWLGLPAVLTVWLFILMTIVSVVVFRIFPPY